MRKFEDLTGQRFGRLTVIKRIENDKYNHIMYLCQCDCGNTKIIRSSHLKSGAIQSCGCYSIEKFIERSATHHKSHSRLYNIWWGMITRCYKKYDKRYNTYGARGIIVCKKWKDNFQEFYDWAMKNGYDETAKRGKCTIDRINVNGNYEPNNCRWIDTQEQSYNTTRNLKIEYNNEIHCLGEWSKLLNIPYKTLYRRIKYSNWSIEKSFTTPIERKDK